MQNTIPFLEEITSKIQERFPDLRFEVRERNKTDCPGAVCKEIYVVGCTTPFCGFTLRSDLKIKVPVVDIFLITSIPDGQTYVFESFKPKHSIELPEGNSSSLYKEHIYNEGKHKVIDVSLNDIIDEICNHLQKQREVFCF